MRRYNNCTNVQECTQSCVFGVHVVGEDGKIADPLEDLCRGCFRCVVECPDLAISVELNPEFQKMGNTYYTPDRIRTIYFESQSGRVPVSGTGYGGPFAGKGFDGIWFDFSEIVRPTRDGIHGREYISTSVDLGRNNPYLTFDEEGNLTTSPPNLVEIPLPMIIDPPLDCSGKNNRLPLAVAKAAEELGTFVIMPLKNYDEELTPYLQNIIPRFNPGEIETAELIIQNARIVEVELGNDASSISECLQEIKRMNPAVLISFFISFEENSPETAVELVNAGADIIHFGVDDEVIEQDPDFITAAIRRVHNMLVEKNMREKISLITSGGIAEAAHVPKSIILGDDAVCVGIPYQIALGCTVCNDRNHAADCLLNVGADDVDWAAQRIINLLGAWRDQLLEVLGGMGLREVRRQRGEMGRIMLFQDLEARIFGGN